MLFATELLSKQWPLIELYEGGRRRGSILWHMQRKRWCVDQQTGPCRRHPHRIPLGLQEGSTWQKSSIGIRQYVGKKEEEKAQHPESLLSLSSKYRVWLSEFITWCRSLRTQWVSPNSSVLIRNTPLHHIYTSCCHLLLSSFLKYILLSL